MLNVFIKFRNDIQIRFMESSVNTLSSWLNRLALRLVGLASDNRGSLGMY